MNSIPLISANDQSISTTSLSPAETNPSKNKDLIFKITAIVAAVLIAASLIPLKVFAMPVVAIITAAIGGIALTISVIAIIILKKKNAALAKTPVDITTTPENKSQRLSVANLIKHCESESTNTNVKRLRKTLEAHNKQFKSYEYNPKALGFIEKRDLPPSKIFVKANLNGNLKELLENLQQLQSQGMLDKDYRCKKDAHLIFLGNFMGEESDNLLVAELLASLKLENPEQVHLIRGAHEYLPKNEVQAKKLSDQLKGKTACLREFYETMPLSLYMSQVSDENQPKKYIQFSHRTLEVSADPAEILDSDDSYKSMEVLKIRQLSERVSKLCLFHVSKSEAAGLDDMNQDIKFLQTLLFYKKEAADLSKIFANLMTAMDQEIKTEFSKSSSQNNQEFEETLKSVKTTIKLSKELYLTKIISEMDRMETNGELERPSAEQEAEVAKAKTEMDENLKKIGVMGEKQEELKNKGPELGQKLMAIKDITEELKKEGQEITSLGNALFHSETEENKEQQAALLKEKMDNWQKKSKKEEEMRSAVAEEISSFTENAQALSKEPIQAVWLKFFENLAKIEDATNDLKKRQLNAIKYIHLAKKFTNLKDRPLTQADINIIKQEIAAIQIQSILDTRPVKSSPGDSNYNKGKIVSKESAEDTHLDLTLQDIENYFQLSSEKNKVELLAQANAKECKSHKYNDKVIVTSLDTAILTTSPEVANWTKRSLNSSENEVSLTS